MQQKAHLFQEHPLDPDEIRLHFKDGLLVIRTTTANHKYVIDTVIPSLIEKELLEPDGVPGPEFTMHDVVYLFQTHALHATWANPK